MARRQLIILGLLALTLTGCVNQSTDKSTRPPDDVGVQSSPYEAFVQKIRSENLGEYGIDIVSMLDEHLTHHTADDGAPYLSEATITRMDYSLEKCNLSQNNEPHPGADQPSLNDMIVSVAIIKDAPGVVNQVQMYVIFAFVLNGNGQFDKVLDDEVYNNRATGIRYEIMDVTGDGRDEIILITRRMRYQESISILTWRPEQDTMSVIFEENLFEFMSFITCLNSYQFVPARSGGYDIGLQSIIYYRAEDIFETGYTRFVFNGNKYEARGTYYDYQARRDAIVEDLQSAK